MKKIDAKYLYAASLVFVFIISECFVNPLGEFPLNDDWSYAKSVMIFQDTGQLEIGNWGAMTLVTHLLWGVTFTKLFGFSFVVLRFSTLLSSLIGVLGIYYLVVIRTSSPKIAFLSALVLLFNPLYFNLSNTFMTDVNFNTLVILYLIAAHSFFLKPRLVSFTAVFLFSLLLVFLRQFGIVAPLAFTIACLLIKDKKFLYFALAVFFTLLIYFSLKYYESWLKNYLVGWSPYKFSEMFDITDANFWELLKEHYLLRYRNVITQILVYIFPLLVLFATGLWRQASRRTLFISAILSFLLCYWLVIPAEFPLNNIFTNMILGPETFYQSWGNNNNHNAFTEFAFIIKAVKIIFSFGSLFLIVISLFDAKARFKGRLKPFSVLLISLSISYIFMLMVADSFFDRYHLPLITIALLALTCILPDNVFDLKWSMLPLFVCIYVSLAGTHDYMTINKMKWQAYNDLKESGIKAEKINGGFEINSWNEGNIIRDYNFVDLSSFDYLIQFRNEKDFSILKEYPFQRYFPIRKDKINIFVRNPKKGS